MPEMRPAVCSGAKPVTAASRHPKNAAARSAQRRPMRRRWIAAEKAGPIIEEEIRRSAAESSFIMSNGTFGKTDGRTIIERARRTCQASKEPWNMASWHLRVYRPENE
jgi:hypothetical protein